MRWFEQKNLIDPLNTLTYKGRRTFLNKNPQNYKLKLEFALLHPST